jgi:predicted house-cleaning noncanonical NTP pyrophosphatase (MazG superfamily)
MPEYNKLVRDKIPEIIEADGMTVVTRVIEDDAEFLSESILKVGEETAELAVATTPEEQREEAADLLEIAMAIAKHLGFDEVEAIRLKKLEERGGFDDKIFLERTE